MARRLLLVPARLFTALSVVTNFITVAHATDPVYISGTGLDGVKRQLDVGRTPALYTGDFADCLDGQSLFNITKFDTAYYADNQTVSFHLNGESNIRNESLIRKFSHPKRRVK